MPIGEEHENRTTKPFSSAAHPGVRILQSEGGSPLIPCDVLAYFGIG